MNAYLEQIRYALYAATRSWAEAPAAARHGLLPMYVPYTERAAANLTRTLLASFFGRLADPSQLPADAAKLDRLVAGLLEHVGPWPAGDATEFDQGAAADLTLLVADTALEHFHTDFLVQAGADGTGPFTVVCCDVLHRRYARRIAMLRVIEDLDREARQLGDDPLLRAGAWHYLAYSLDYPEGPWRVRRDARLREWLHMEYVSPETGCTSLEDRLSVRRGLLDGARHTAKLMTQSISGVFVVRQTAGDQAEFEHVVTGATYPVSYPKARDFSASELLFGRIVPDGDLWVTMFGVLEVADVSPDTVDELREYALACVEDGLQPAVVTEAVVSFLQDPDETPRAVPPADSIEQAREYLDGVEAWRAYIDAADAEIALARLTDPHDANDDPLVYDPLRPPDGDKPGSVLAEWMDALREMVAAGAE